MYLVVIAILGIILTMTEPLYRLVQGVWPVTAAIAAAILLPPLAAYALGQATVRQLDAHPANPARGQAMFGWGTMLLQVLLGVLHAALLLVTDWMSWCADVPVVGAWIAVPGILSLAPFLVSVWLVWIALYPADRGIRQIAVEAFLFRGKPVRPAWGLSHFVLYNFRHQVLFILVPMLLILAAHDTIVYYQNELVRWTGLRYAPDLLVGLSAVVVAVIAPELLRYIWSTRRLPVGPLRDRLLLLAGKLGLRCRDVLVWRSGGMVVNAAVMGVIPPLRYVMITDAMIEQMADDRIEAVFGHEAGHVKRHHILFLLLFALISGCAATVFMYRTHRMAQVDPPLYQAAATLFGAAMLAKWGILYGWISRRFERQADVYGARALTLTGLPCSQPCSLHGNANDRSAPPAGSVALCRTAADLFSQALYEVAELNGMRPKAPSWRHSSIESRSQFLHKLATDPREVLRFERRVRAVKLGILLTAVVAAAWAAHDMGLWEAATRIARA